MQIKQLNYSEDLHSLSLEVEIIFVYISYLCKFDIFQNIKELNFNCSLRSREKFILHLHLPSVIASSKKHSKTLLSFFPVQ